MGWYTWNECDLGPLPCARCGKMLRTGDRIYLVKILGGQVVRAEHVACFWAREKAEMTDAECQG